MVLPTWDTALNATTAIKEASRAYSTRSWPVSANARRCNLACNVFMSMAALSPEIDSPRSEQLRVRRVLQLRRDGREDRVDGLSRAFDGRHRHQGNQRHEQRIFERDRTPPEGALPGAGF